ncbi:MAG: 50S ribosomal protein L4 [Calditrichaeota bacterium]|nr:50S ribosomal protein L4 [Calditrichota bacterium]
METPAAEPRPLKLPVKCIDGTPTGDTVELDPRLFGLERNDHVLYLAVKAELANKRQGTHAVKNRALVRGGGRKPWRQKGRGAARAGSTRSPIWIGGGAIHGPQPHYYLQKLPLKVKRLARRIALSVKAQSGVIDLIEDFDYNKPRTRSIADILKAFEIKDISALLMVDGYKPAIAKSARNIPRVEVRDASQASTYDILRARRLLICRSALNNLVGGLASE